MKINKEGKEYLIVEIPLTTKNVTLGIPYSNNVIAPVPLESNNRICIVNFIKCEDISPNNPSIEYKVIGKQSELKWKVKGIEGGKEYVIIMVKKK